MDSCQPEADKSLAATYPFWAVIPAGGPGTRLWPLSREARPKFLLPLAGKQSLLQQTAKRLAPLTSPERTLVVCGTAHAAAIARQLPALPEARIVVEPSPKGSGPAIGLAAALVARHEPGALMGSFAADHVVQDEPAFQRAITTAIAAAHAGWLCTIGLQPSRAETGYGYIERTDEAIIETAHGAAFRAASFHEKPDADLAGEYAASGRFLWNASMFVWRVQTLLDEMARLQPALHDGLMRLAEVWGAEDQERQIAEIWSDLPYSTIDQGIMDHASRVAVVPAEMGWSDIGDWHGFGNLLDQDSAGNAISGEVIQEASRGCVVYSGSARLIALVGLDDTIVVDTPDALLVAKRDHAQEVRAIVQRLKELDRDDWL
ncbi:MAG TPA: sugar phosphate nucleotidyltransferase [Thermomicrobiales bacterium]|nr:sugar phosphate nucleotidyltransferase [Thermomicrobiales bacterium]